VPEPTQYRIAATSASELVRDVEAAVVSGALRPGERLPSVRRLAAEVGLSPVTVAAGITELRRRGVVVTEPRRGTRIGDVPPIGSPARPLPVPDGACDLSHGNPDPALLPDLHAALAGLRLPARLYGEPPDVPELLAHARRVLAGEGISGGATCIVSGAHDGIERVLATHLRPGDRVAVEDPGYAALYDLLRAQGLGLRPVALDEQGMLPHELERALQEGVSAVVLTPRGQNPTGAALDEARARELRRTLARHERTLVIEDDHLGPVAGVPLHSVGAGRERWAATRSVAKALGPDLRLAVLAGDAYTVARVQGRQQCGPGWVSHVLQRLVLELWSDREAERHVARASAAYARRREALIGALAREGVAASAASGLNVWIPVTDEAAVVASLLARGWVVAPGARYRLRSPPAVRVTTAALDPERAPVLAADLGAILSARGAARTG
jgi:DNA-binding transcriptional MocR family regulator